MLSRKKFKGGAGCRHVYLLDSLISSTFAACCLTQPLWVWWDAHSWDLPGGTPHRNAWDRQGLDLEVLSRDSVCVWICKSQTVVLFIYIMYIFCFHMGLSDLCWDLKTARREEHSLGNNSQMVSLIELRKRGIHSDFRDNVLCPLSGLSWLLRQ